MSSMTSAIVSGLLVMSMILSIVAAVGIHRLRDPFSRMHATATVNSLGIILIFLASVFYFSGESFATSHNLRQLLTIVFVFVTVPAGTHILTRAAIARDVKMWKVDGKLSEAERAAIRSIKEQSEARKAARTPARD